MGAGFPPYDDAQDHRRPGRPRGRDIDQRLTNGVDVWVASALADGAPYLVPLSFDWDGAALLGVTPTDTARMETR